MIKYSVWRDDWFPGTHQGSYFSGIFAAHSPYDKHRPSVQNYRFQIENM